MVDNASFHNKIKEFYLSITLYVVARGKYGISLYG